MVHYMAAWFFQHRDWLLLKRLNKVIFILFTTIKFSYILWTSFAHAL